MDLPDAACPLAVTPPCSPVGCILGPGLTSPLCQCWDVWPLPPPCWSTAFHTQDSHTSVEGSGPDKGLDCDAVPRPQMKLRVSSLPFLMLAFCASVSMGIFSAEGSFAKPGCRLAFPCCRPVGAPCPSLDALFMGHSELVNWLSKYSTIVLAISGPWLCHVIFRVTFLTSGRIILLENWDIISL